MTTLTSPVAVAQANIDRDIDNSRLGLRTINAERRLKAANTRQQTVIAKHARLLGCTCSTWDELVAHQSA